MKTIKNRETVRDIKVLDRSALVGERMKDAYIRTKENSKNLLGDESDSPSEYAGNQVEHGVSQLSHDTVSLTRAGGEALARQRAKKKAEKARAERNAPKEQPPTGEPHAPSSNVELPPISSEPQPPSTGYEGHPVAAGPTSKRGTGSAEPQRILEQGREYAKEQAIRRTERNRTIKTRDFSNIQMRTLESTDRTVVGLVDSAYPDQVVLPTKTSRSLPAPDPASVVSHRVRYTEQPVKIKTSRYAEGTMQQSAMTFAQRNPNPGTIPRTIKAVQKPLIKISQPVSPREPAQKAAIIARQKALAVSRNVRSAVRSARPTFLIKTVGVTVRKAASKGRDLAALITVGGWAAVLAIIVLCLVVSASFSIILSDEDNGMELSEADEILLEELMQSEDLGELAEEYDGPIQEGKGGYIWPLPGYSRISSPFGYRNCPYHGRELHGGVDLPAPYGSSILAAKSGTVITSTYGSSFGNYIVISHGDGSRTLYAHMSSRLVSVGDTVNQGTIIGKVGSTGNSTGNHLHFEVWTNGSSGSKVNPMSYF